MSIILLKNEIGFEPSGRVRAPFLQASLLAVFLILFNFAPEVAVAWQDQTLGRLNESRSAAAIESPFVNPDHTVIFRLMAPHATSVVLSADFLNGRTPLEKYASGLWQITTPPVDPGVYSYRFIVDGLQTVDPANPKIYPSYVLANTIEVRDGKPFTYDLLPNVPHGTIRLETFDSKLLKKIVQFYVYTPPGYEENSRHYPVLYDLHGAPGFPGLWGQINSAQRTLDNLIAEGKCPAMVYVIPTAEIAPFFPFPRPKEPSLEESQAGLQLFEHYFLDEFIPYVEKKYRIERKPRSRWLTGYSLGGLESFHVAVRHPELFSVVRVAATGFLLGELFKQSLESHYPELKDTKSLNDHLRLFYLDCGNRDAALPQMRHADLDLTRFGIAHEFTVSSSGGGTHQGASPSAAFASFIRRLQATVSKDSSSR